MLFRALQLKNFVSAKEGSQRKQLQTREHGKYRPPNTSLSSHFEIVGKLHSEIVAPC